MSIHEIQSPLPGTFYRKPSPDEAPFAEVGDKVEAGAVLGLVEVMKQYSQLTADIAGTIREFCIDDGDIVEPGQVVVRIEPHSS